MASILILDHLFSGYWHSNDTVYRLSSVILNKNSSNTQTNHEKLDCCFRLQEFIFEEQPDVVNSSIYHIAGNFRKIFIFGYFEELLLFENKLPYKFC